jgi:hypothetical protein
MIEDVLNEILTTLKSIDSKLAKPVQDEVAPATEPAKRTRKPKAVEPATTEAFADVVEKAAATPAKDITADILADLVDADPVVEEKTVKIDKKQLGDEVLAAVALYGRERVEGVIAKFGQTRASLVAEAKWGEVVAALKALGK